MADQTNHRFDVESKRRGAGGTVAASLFAFSTLAVMAASASAQSNTPEPDHAVEAGDGHVHPAYAAVPPHVEETPVVAGNGAGYCYAGPHATDTRISGTSPWDETKGRHIHTYPPFDLRLFALRDGCYHFIGDPTDFGYRGDSFHYYGAHPVMIDHGGGWCFMIGGHRHWWRPWSPYFMVAGSFYYWHGPYDPFFWHHWPYYAVYYRHHYPRHYRGGRFARGGWHGESRQHAVAGRVGPVTAPPVSAPAALASGQPVGAAGQPVSGRPVPGQPMASGTQNAWSQLNQDQRRALRDVTAAGQQPGFDNSDWARAARAAQLPAQPFPQQPPAAFNGSDWTRGARQSAQPDWPAAADWGRFRSPTPAAPSRGFDSRDFSGFRAAPSPSPSRSFDPSFFRGSSGGGQSPGGNWGGARDAMRGFRRN